MRNGSAHARTGRLPRAVAAVFLAYALPAVASTQVPAPHPATHAADERGGVSGTVRNATGAAQSGVRGLRRASNRSGVTRGGGGVRYDHPALIFNPSWCVHDRSVGVLAWKIRHRFVAEN